MATKIHDFAHQAVLAGSVGPLTATVNQNGTGVDLIAGDGNGFAILTAGAVQAGTTVGGKVQESDTGAAWTDVAGATLPNLGTSFTSGAITFVRTKRYVRCVVTLAGSSPQAAVCALVGEQRKGL